MHQRLSGGSCTPLLTSFQVHAGPNQDFVASFQDGRCVNLCTYSFYHVFYHVFLSAMEDDLVEHTRENAELVARAVAEHLELDDLIIQYVELLTDVMVANKDVFDHNAELFEDSIGEGSLTAPLFCNVVKKGF